MKRLVLAATLIHFGALTAQKLSAQQLDITREPKLAEPALLKIPPVQRTKLPNQLTLYVIEQHEVPVVQLMLSVNGGGREDESKPGLATFTADMLDEGADTLDAFELAAQVAFLGAELSSDANWDRMLVSLKVPSKSLDPAAALMATIALKPSFSAREVERQRNLRLAAILQDRDQPQVVASNVFNALVFPAGHPYHKPLTGDSAATAGLDSTVVRAFYGKVFRPDQATIIVSGDITLAQARRVIAREFGNWRASEKLSTSSEAEASPTSRPRAVYLVDKPGAAQSVIMIGGPGVERNSPDYYALQVMNTLLGGSFSSRLNYNLRETKGYTYGAFSNFEYRPLPGPFSARAAVRTDVTDSSLVEFFREFRRIRDSVVPDDELRRAEAFIALQLPGRFETASDLATQLSELLMFGLPLEYYGNYTARIMAVRASEVQRVARKYLQPDRVSIVIVGDVQKTRAGVTALNLGQLSLVDMEGNPVAAR